MYLLIALLFYLGFGSQDVLFSFANVVPPQTESLIFAETFSKDWDQRWVTSTKPEFTGKWAVQTPTGGLGADVPYQSPDKGLVAGSEARKHAITVKFPKVLRNDDAEELVIQYEVRLQQGLTCGGAYIKLLTRSTLPDDLADFDNTVPFTIMFGPDKCGNDNKVHFIIRHKNPVSGEYTEHHMKERPKIIDDLKTHLYTLIIRSDNTFTIKIDNEEKRQGSLLEDFEPPFNPPATIPDPTDQMPSDWVTNEQIPDPQSKKPEDWDDNAPMTIPDPDDQKPTTWLDNAPLTIPDPSISKPEDWDDELDGDWEAPYIPNPACAASGCGVWKPKSIKNPNHRGVWKPAMIANPDYKGIWRPRELPNPNYFVEKNPYKLEAIEALGIEIWTMSANIMFDNIVVSHDSDDLLPFIKSWEEKHILEEKLISEHTATDFVTFVTDIVNGFGAFASDPDNFYTVIALIAMPSAGIAVSCFFLCKGSPKDEEDDEIDFDDSDEPPKPTKLVGPPKQKQPKKRKVE